MLLTDQKRHGIHFKVAWYAKEPVKGNGIIQYRQAEFRGGNDTHVFSTLVSDLTLSEEEIVQRFAKSCKYKVNRAPREGVECQVFSKEALTAEILAEFLRFFEQFWISKGKAMSGEEIRELGEEMTRYREQDGLCISRAILGGEPVVYHTYVTDETHARLLHSASLYRAEEDDTKANILGMANRYLHKEDMFAFKRMGKRLYDWGGAGRTEEVLQITKFKESFGGDAQDYYHFTEVRGLWPKIFMRLAKILGK